MGWRQGSVGPWCPVRPGWRRRYPMVHPSTREGPGCLLSGGAKAIAQAADSLSSAQTARADGRDQSRWLESVVPSMEWPLRSSGKCR